MRKIVAGIEIIGGLLVLCVFFAGLYMMFTTQPGATEWSQWSWQLILSVVITVLFGFINIFAGINLWRDKQSGYAMSILAQLIQLVSVQTANFYNVFYTIFGLIVSFGKPGLGMTYGVGTSYLLSLDPQPVPTTFVGINLVALVLLFVVLFLNRKRARMQKMFVFS